MAYARKGGHETGHGETAGAEGYAGVALDVLEGTPGDSNRVRVLVVPRPAALPDLPGNLAVEVSCRIHDQGAEPMLNGPVPGECSRLILQVGACERMVAESILQGDARQLEAALETHPLVGPGKVAACMEAFRF